MACFKKMMINAILFCTATMSTLSGAHQIVASKDQIHKRSISVAALGGTTSDTKAQMQRRAMSLSADGQQVESLDPGTTEVDNSLDATVQTKHEGGLEQTKHKKCMAAITATNWNSETTILEETSCNSTDSDMLWNTNSDKQIRLQDRELCLEAQETTTGVFEVFARDCLQESQTIEEMKQKFKMQQWNYSHDLHEVKTHSKLSGNHLCLSTESGQPRIFLETCKPGWEEQKWQILKPSLKPPSDDLIQSSALKTQMQSRAMSLSADGRLATDTMRTTKADESLDAGTTEVDNSLDATVQAKSSQAKHVSYQGRLKQTEHQKCMAAINIAEGDSEITQLVETSCDSDSGTHRDMFWKSTLDRQIRLQDRGLCLEAEETTTEVFEVFARDCLEQPKSQASEEMKQNFAMQQWFYSHTLHEVKTHSKFGGGLLGGTHLCLSTKKGKPLIFLETCKSAKKEQRWKILE